MRLELATCTQAALNLHINLSKLQLGLQLVFHGIQVCLLLTVSSFLGIFLCHVPWHFEHFHKFFDASASRGCVTPMNQRQYIHDQ